jgi:NAD(P)-dependent dehydrogenase (short-subunit alcohol dehydrogenase family)
MTYSLTSLPDRYRAVVFGATGGIGSAFVQHLVDDPKCGVVFAASRQGLDVHSATGLSFDLDVPESIDTAMAAAAADGPLHLVIAATGGLHSQGAMEPEKSWRQIGHDRFLDALRVNTVLPSLIASAALGRLARGDRAAPEKAIFAALSARVGSISDNRLGGWHSYRAAKAALNQVIRTCSIELARKAPHALCVGLHPGTVDTALSKPFQRGVPEGKLFTPAYSAERLLTVLDGLDPSASGKVFDWAGEEIAP